MKQKSQLKSYTILLAALCFAPWALQAQDYEEVSKRTAFDPDIPSTDRQTLARYGYRAMAADGEYAVIGAFGQDVTVSSTTYAEAGAAYILKKVSGEWEYYQKIVASDPDTGAHFGCAVGISGDHIIVGAMLDEHPSHAGADHGTAYIFELNGSTWTETHKFDSPSPANNGFFGQGVDIYAGTTDTFAVIGQPRSSPHGSVFVFEKNGGPWSLNSTLSDGTASVAGKNQYFGNAVAIHDDYLIVGSPNGFLLGSTSIYGGRAYIYHYDGTDWETTAEELLIATDQDSGDQYGYVVDITNGYAIVGAMYEKSPLAPTVSTGSGAAYIYERNISTTNDWDNEYKLTTPKRVSAEQFGYSVSITPDFALIGAPNDKYEECGTTINQTGSTYLFKRGSVNNWPMYQQLFASDKTIQDLFGSGVAISGTSTEPTFFVGAMTEDHDDLGATFISNSGSVYIFEVPPMAMFDAPVTEKTDEETLLEIENSLFKVEKKPETKTEHKAELKIQPAGDHVLNIRIEQISGNPIQGTGQLQLFNSMGQVLQTTAMQSNTTATINTQGLATGVYFIRVEFGSFRQVRKIMIHKS